MKGLKEVTDFLVRLALTEDVGSGDITSKAIIPTGEKARAVIVAREAGVIAGIEVAKEVFQKVDQRIKFFAKVRDGAAVKRGTILALLAGPARGILTGERVALNFLQHLSGIATLTRKFKIQISCLPAGTAKSKTKVILLDTRKTIPGLRVLEKYAVKVGGGVNHRMGLYDAILVKDNHIKLAGGIERAVRAVRAVRERRDLREKKGAKGIEVEAKSIAEVKKAVRAGVDRILLDNMNIRVLREAVKLCRKAGIKTEASGGVNLENVAAIARTGVDYISVGALTHSAKALDISMKTK